MPKRGEPLSAVTVSHAVTMVVTVVVTVVASLRSSNSSNLCCRMVRPSRWLAELLIAIDFVAVCACG